MKKHSYQLKDEVLGFIADRVKPLNNSVKIENSDFEYAFSYNPKGPFFSTLLNELISDGLVISEKVTSYQSIYTITPKGFDFIRDGGYVQKLKLENKEKKHKSREYLLLSWKIKWFWISQALAFLAFVISIFALFN